MNRLFFLLFIVVGLTSCEESKKNINKFSDPILIKIADHQDRRLSDSLVIYFTNENSTYRKAGVLAFGSIQDSTVVEQLGKVLSSDKDNTIRKTAAFALGQTSSQQSVTILTEASSKEKDNEVLKEILEAYGKVTKKWTSILSSNNNTTLEEGIAWSLYRAGLNGTVDSTNNILAADLLGKSHSDMTRLGAAHFFARGAKSPGNVLKQIADAAIADNSVDVQMAAAFALRKIKTDSSFFALEKILLSNVNYRVKVNALRAFQAFPFERTKNYLLESLTNPNVNIGVTASEVIINTVKEDSWIELANKVTELRNWRIQANVYQGILKVHDAKSVTDEIKSIYQKSRNPYQKAALLTALQQSYSALDFIETELANADTAVLRSTAAGALVELNKNKNFKPADSKRFADSYVKALNSGDPAVIGTIAATLADSTLGYRKTIKEFSFLYEAKKKLSLPKDNESLQPLEAAIAHFEKRKLPSAPKNEFNHPINWELVKSIPTEQRAIIQTSKGSITLRLLVEEAPGSVANFVSLAQGNYFDNKFFHRVVPNFVIQAGCNRGDGWGSEDYSIRSEFNEKKYNTGSVGMASSGKDTEGTQWFITHSPTPHLDGRYTIFAEVERGMEAVHLMEVGDQILSVEIKIGSDEKK